MYVKRMTILAVLLLSLVLAIPVMADAPGDGTVYEGVSVPGAALGDTRAQVDAAYGPTGCQNFYCTFDAEGGGRVTVYYQGPNGGDSTGSPDDVAVTIRWNEDVDGWKTTAGINTTLAKSNKQAAVDAYPNAYLKYDSVGRLITLHDPELGIEIFWNHAYIFYNVSMKIFYPYTPPPPPDYIRVADIDLRSDTRKSVTARVLVLDEQDDPVEGANVLVWWVYPVNKNNNTNMYTTGTTAGDGYATFRIDKASRGDYRISIENVTKEGFKFDANNSVMGAVFTKTK